jgi:PKD repeat protein
MKYILSLLILLVGLKIKAQDLKHCGQQEAMNRLYKKYPNLRASASAKKNRNFSNSINSNQTLVIPVVFHIMHVYGGENISDEQVRDAVRILNEDFQATNLDTADIVPAFKDLKGVSTIEFRLAKIDPQGNCTNGINHVFSELTNTGEDDVKFNQWDPSKYLNIWTVKSISFGAAGYAYYPTSADGWPQIDGIVILADYVGSIGTGNYTRARALTHEVGHYLELQHVWGDTNDPGISCGDDEVFDTPVTEGWVSCNLNGIKCTPGVIENVQNYMEYSYCGRMFTVGQVSRMLGILNSNIANRNNLWKEENLVATGTDEIRFNDPAPCSPRADFTSDKRIVCAQSLVKFTDLSSNADANSWYWEFEGGNPSTSNLQNPQITYPVPGTYKVKLKLGNITGTDSIEKNQFINVLNNVALYQNYYVEGFEDFNQALSELTVINDDAFAFQQNNSVSASGNSSIALNNVWASQGINQVDAIVTPGIDVSSIPSPTLSFKLAYAQQTTSSENRLRVLVSSNCGLTWFQRYFKYGDNLSTAPNQSNAFIPQPNEWRTELITINNVLNASNVLVKFEYTNNTGNNLYIDDINLYSNVTGINEGITDNFILYPNPASKVLNIEFNSANSKPHNIEVSDLLGKQIINTRAIEGNKQQIDISLLSKGLYLVRINYNNYSVVKRFSIE